jgi:hypothetical protein
MRLKATDRLRGQCAVHFDSDCSFHFLRQFWERFRQRLRGGGACGPGGRRERGQGRGFVKRGGFVAVNSRRKRQARKHASDSTSQRTPQKGPAFVTGRVDFDTIVPRSLFCVMTFLDRLTFLRFESFVLSLVDPSDSTGEPDPQSPSRVGLH